MRTTLLKCVVVVVGVSLSSHPVWGAITSAGAISPVPPAGGGDVFAPFLIGHNDIGTMGIAGGTPLATVGPGDTSVGSNAGGVGIVTMSGLDSDWFILNRLLVGHADGVGSVTLSNLAVLTVQDVAILADEGGSMGQINVTGLGTTWDNSAPITVGEFGLGTVEVTSGGQVTSETSVLGFGVSSEGSVRVSGEFSRWFIFGAITVGDSGRGTLIVQNGGRVTHTMASTVGRSVSATAAGVGVVEVSGAGSLWETGGDLVVGSSGWGFVRVLDGGRIASSSPVMLATVAGSRGEVVVDGTDSIWTVAGALTTGPGDASITVSNGGVVRTATGPTIEVNGRVTLDGGRLETAGTPGPLPLPFTHRGLIQGSGVIDVPTFNIATSGANRGRLYASADDHLILTGGGSNAGVIDLDGGQFEVRNGFLNLTNGDIDARNGATLRFGVGGLDNFDGGQLSITGGAVDVFDQVRNNPGGEIAVVGGATGVFHDLVINNGIVFVSPGSEIVLLEDLGFSAGAALSVQLAAIDRGGDPTDGFGQALSSGQVTLAGTLNVSLVGGYMPELGSTFQIVSAGGGRSGIFATESLPALAGGLGWDVVYSANAVTLAVIPALPGDYNADGVVDAADYVVWRKNVGTTNVLPNDPDGGTIGPLQYATWRANFGPGDGGSADLAGGDSTAPEPGRAMPISLAAVGGLVVRRRGPSALPQRSSAVSSSITADALRRRLWRTAAASPKTSSDPR